MKVLVYIILILIIAFFVRKFLQLFKIPVVGSVCMVTGAVKSGKSTFAYGCAEANYRRVHFAWKIRVWLCKLFKRKPPEEPLFYSNIPVGVPYVKLTTAQILRQHRCRYGSVVFIDEATLLADSQLIKDMDINERINLYFKLFGHMSHGGKCIINTQCIADTHYGIKRSLGNYFYVHHLVKWLPFFNLVYVRECLYSDDNTTTNAVTKDAELDLRRVIIRKSVWKRFDSYAFSSLTDDLPVDDKVIKPVKNGSLKVEKVISFRKFRSIDKKFLESECVENDNK